MASAHTSKITKQNPHLRNDPAVKLLKHLGVSSRAFKHIHDELLTEQLKRNSIPARNLQITANEFEDFLSGLKQAKLSSSYKMPPHLKHTHVTAGEPSALTVDQEQQLDQLINRLMPWRKGPFYLWGKDIDAEWRSDFKWAKIKPHLGSLQGKCILDLGCNNGYTLFQMNRQKPRIALGLDPTLLYYLQYKLIKAAGDFRHIHMQLGGFEHLHLMNRCFDVVLCMGILYHHPDPIGILHAILKTMRPGGLLIVESLGIEGNQSSILLPESRYMGLPGHWFIPTQNALETMIRRAGFGHIQTFHTLKLDLTEQRPTPFAPHSAMIDGMSADRKATIENLSPPWRFYIKARKMRVR